KCRRAKREQLEILELGITKALAQFDNRGLVPPCTAAQEFGTARGVIESPAGFPPYQWGRKGLLHVTDVEHLPIGGSNVCLDNTVAGRIQKALAIQGVALRVSGFPELRHPSAGDREE